MSARERVGRARAELTMLEAAAEQQDALAAAKQAYDADPSAENLAARRAAMADVHHFRSTFRGLDRLRLVRAELADAPRARGQLKSALAKATDDEEKAKIQAALKRLSNLEAELPKLEELFGPVAAYFEAMGALTLATAPSTTPPGRVKKERG